MTKEKKLTFEYRDEKEDAKRPIPKDYNVCIKLVNRKGEEFRLCNDTSEDMGKRKSTLLSDEKPKEFQNIKKLAKHLHNKDMSPEEIERGISHASASFRDSIETKSEYGGGVDVAGYSVKAKKRSETRTE